MRKNGVNRELIPVRGGVCAPAGFQAGGVYCGIVADERRKEDLSLVVSKRRSACACVYAQGGVTGAPAALTKKRLQSGYARAVIVNSGVANVFMEGGEKLARNICTLLSNKLSIREEEIAIASTGTVGKLPFAPIENKMDALVFGLGETHEHSLAAARGLMTADKTVKQLSYAFELGDYVCKIGAVFKGSLRVCPNMATTLCILTTDIDIAPKLLQKAFSSAVNATLNLLNVDGVGSPNDFACILANGLAGNYQISADDSEYKKFSDALHAVMANIARTIAQDGGGRVAQCRVVGARSGRAARAAAKAIANASVVKVAMQKGTVDIDGVLCALHTAGEPFDFEKLGVYLGELVVLEQGRRQELSDSTLLNAFNAETLTLRIRLGSGNYTATSTFVF